MRANARLVGLGLVALAVLSGALLWQSAAGAFDAEAGLGQRMLLFVACGSVWFGLSLCCAGDAVFRMRRRR